MMTHMASRFDWPGLLFAAAITLAALLIMMR
jgi:hypothetical protein